MKMWPLISLLLLADLRGQVPGADLRLGDEALAAGLWEIAGMHYRDGLADKSLTPEAKAALAVRLAETLVRAGNAAEALEWLGPSAVATQPEAPFWKAQALAAQGKLSEALEILKTLKSSPQRTEAGFTQASLQLALGQPDAALEALENLIPGSDAVTTAKIQLHQVEILLDLKRPADARRKMPASDAVAAVDRPHAQFLEAQLLLAEVRPAEAEVAFQELANQPQGQTLEHYHAVFVGLADARLAQGNPTGAAASLIAFLQSHPESPLLGPLFERLLASLPAKPAATDPILEALAGWIVPAVLPAIGPVASDHGASAAWPIYLPAEERPQRLAFAIHARAVGLHRVGTPEARQEARRLLGRLRVEYPEHRLASQALYQQSRWLLDAGEMDAAFSLLDTLRESGNPPELRGEAAFLKARSAYQAGDPQQAVRLFEEAAETLAAPEARIARLRAAVARLRGGMTLVQNAHAPSDPALEADLELERALAATPPATASAALGEFLARHPDHPRAEEARLAATEAALAGPTPDLTVARVRLNALDAAPGATVARRIALARLRLADLTGDAAATIAAAQAIMDAYPADSAEAAFTLGRNLFQTGSYNPARLVLEKLAASDSDPARAQAAWLLAARSAALGGTPQSKEEALILFDKAAGLKGPLSAIATLEKAGHLIDTYQLPEAAAFLGKWLKTLPEDDPLRLPGGLLLGGALYAQGSSNPASLVQALAVYDELLVQVKDQPALLNRLHYLRGTTLELLPDLKDPAKKRETQAFQAFYSVLETTGPPAEWEYFERSGFRALAMLEKAKRWQAAVNIARKIASFNGPRAAEAAARASKIQLEQMMW